MIYKVGLFGFTVVAGVAISGCDTEGVYLYRPYVTAGEVIYGYTPHAYGLAEADRSVRLRIYPDRYRAAPYWGRYYYPRPRYGYHYYHYRPHRRFHRFRYGHHGHRRYPRFHGRRRR